MDRVRRSSLLLLVLILLTCIPAGSPGASAAPYGQAGDQDEAPPTPPLTVQTPSYRQQPALALEVTVAPAEITIGATATLTVTITNRAPYPAHDLVVTLPTPDGTMPLPGAGFVSAATGWQWSLQRLAGNTSTSVQAQARVVRMPRGAALLAQAQATARDSAEPTRAAGGTRVIDRTTGPATTRFTPGQAARLRSSDGHVTVELPPGAAARALTLHAGRTPQNGEHVPTGRPGWKRGWGSVFLTATDDAGEDVHQFSAPVTLSMSYTPEQLQALGTTEADLTIFWFDEAQNRWTPLPTTVNSQTRTASTSVDHFSAYQLSDGSSPSAAYVPSLQGFQVSQFTGAASYSIPMEVPTGAGGLKPTLALSYSSATSDGSAGARQHWQASWVGKGWSLDPGGSVSVNKSLAGDGWNHFSFVFGGHSFDAVRGQLLPAYTGNDYGDQNLSHWSWHATDENFMRVRAEDLGNGNYNWSAWSKDGTRYSFTTALNAHDSHTSYVYKWLLSEVMDIHGNRVVYDYHIDTDLGYQPTSYLKAIYWGYDGATPGTGTPRYKIEFTQESRWTAAVDLQWEYPTCDTCGTYWSRFTPHEAYRLKNIRMLSMPPGATGYQLVRQYNLDYQPIDSSVYSDHLYGQRVLTLKSVQEVGKDGVSAQPQTSFSYVPVGQAGANRLHMIDNGQGGQVQFSYQAVWPTPPASKCACLYGNFYRVSEVRRIETANPSGPTRALTTYEYHAPALNDASNAATIVYAMFPPSGNGISLQFLAHQEEREFRGHAWVLERQYNDADPATTLVAMNYHWFYQGRRTDNNTPDCTLQITNNRLTEDACFQQMVKHESWKGREYQSETRAPDGTLLQRTRHTFAREELPFFGSDSSVPDSAGRSNNYKRAGVWRAFSYESESTAEIVEGSATPLIKTTRYNYDPALQSGKQFGNLTTIEEREGATPYRVTQRYYSALDTPTKYIVDRVWQEAIKDGQGNFLALTASFYDGSSTAGVVSTRGLLTQLRKYFNVPLQTSLVNVTLYSSDTSYTYDPYGNPLTTTTYAEAGTRSYNGSVVTNSAPGNGSAAYTTTTTYDGTFHAFSVRVDPPTVNNVTLTEQAEYDYHMGTLTKVIDPNNVATFAEYDVFGRMVKLIKPGDSSQYPTVEALYHDNERPFRYVVRQREVSGQAAYRSTQTFYDGWGRTIQTKRESQNMAQTIVTDQRYDAAGNVMVKSQPRYVNETGTAFGAYTLPNSNVLWTTTSYDTLGRPLEITRPDGTKERHRYFLQGNRQLHDYADANRHRTVTRSDVWGRRVEVNEFAGDCSAYWSAYSCVAPYTTSWTNASTTTYRYTPLDLLDQVTDAHGNITSMVYDSLGRKLMMTDPDMGTWRYAYDVGGNLLGQTDAKNQTTTFRYDILSRLTNKISSDGREAIYRYDEPYGFGKGQRTSMELRVNGAQHSYTSFYYDQRGRNDNRGHLVAGMTGARHIVWTYDSADRVTSIRYPSNETVSYTYDHAWRQTSACSSLGGCYATNAQYSALDQPTNLTFGNNLPQSWWYTGAMHRLEQTYVGNPGGMFDRYYTYDPGGNVASIEDLSGSSTKIQRFTYDHRDRLTSVIGPTVTDNDTYTYDAIGNLLQKRGQTYTYGTNGNGTGAGPHQVRTKGGWSYSYDANGNLLSHNGRSYIWNSDNLPTRITQTSGGASNMYVENYTYDAEGERLTRTAGGVTTVYLAGIWEEELQTGLTRSYYSLNGQVVAQRTSSPNEVLYLHSDHLGSVSAVTNANGLLVSKQDFTPWGEIRGSSITQTSLNYTGQRRDGTGLLYYHARYYDPALGRFISADSVVPGSPTGALGGEVLKPLTVDFHEVSFILAGNLENQAVLTQGFLQQETIHAGPSNAQALNRYSYVQNNPLKYTDPTGHKWYTRNQVGVMKPILKQARRDLAKLYEMEQGAVDAAMGQVIGGLTSLAKTAVDAGISFLADLLTGLTDILKVDVHSAGEMVDVLEWIDDRLDEYIEWERQNSGYGIEFILESQYQEIKGGGGRRHYDLHSRYGDRYHKEKAISTDIYNVLKPSLGDCGLFGSGRCAFKGHNYWGRLPT